MRKLAAILIGKILISTTRLIRVGGGSALPGLIAEKIDPNILKSLSSGFKKGSIIITGTNGKTTTAKMISVMLKQAGLNPISNRSGSNLIRGLVSTLIDKSNFLGKIDADIGVFEIDEATCPEAIEKLEVRTFVVLNLFRDQLDRYGEVDKIAKILKDTIEKLPPNTKIILNADDPLVAALKPKNQTLFFGINDPCYATSKYQYTADTRNCPQCQETLEFETCYFSHLGQYHCPKCQFQRPKTQITAQEIKLRGPFGSEFKVGGVNFPIQVPGFYNIYNALATIAIGKALNLNDQTIQEGLSKFKAAFGRVEKIKINNKNIFMLLVKNPTSYNEVLRTITHPEHIKYRSITLLVGLNDLFSDGTDVSWIWDVNFEELKKIELKVKKIITSGIRAEDLALRMKYAGLNPNKIQIIKELKEAFLKSIEDLGENEILYILPTYTVMLNFRKVIRNLGYLKEYLG